MKAVHRSVPQSLRARKRRQTRITRAPVVCLRAGWVYVRNVFPRDVRMPAWVVRQLCALSSLTELSKSDFTIVDEVDSLLVGARVRESVFPAGSMYAQAEGGAAGVCDHDERLGRWGAWLELPGWLMRRLVARLLPLLKDAAETQEWGWWGGPFFQVLGRTCTRFPVPADK